MSAQDVFAETRAFLEKEALSHFISEHHQELATLRKGTSKVADAMKLLAEKQILSTPILDEEGEYLGAVSVPDVLRGLVRNLEANLGEGYLDNLKSVSAEELNNLGTFFASKDAGSVLHEADLWMRGDASTTLMSVLREGFQIENTRVHHRIYVCDPAKASHKVSSAAGTTVVNIPLGSEKEGASAWKPTDVVTQLDFVCLLAEKGLAQPVTSTVQELGLARTIVSTVTEDTPALVAFHHMAMDHKSSVGITNAAGKLVGCISVSDLRELPVSQFGLLLKPVKELIPSVFTHARLDTCTPATPFNTLVNQMVAGRLHRVYVVGEDGSACSVITLTDVLRAVSGCSIPKARRSLDIQREFEDNKRRSMEEDNSASEEEEAEEAEKMEQ